MQQAAPVGDAPLDLRRITRVVRDDRASAPSPTSGTPGGRRCSRAAGPAWQAPVCDDQSVSHSARWCVPSRIQRARAGALPSRSARRSTPCARPSISRKSTPGTSLRSTPPRAAHGSAHEVPPDPFLLVDGEDRGRQRRDQGQAEHDDDRGAEAVDLHAGQERRDQQHDRAVEQQRAEAERQHGERQRQPQERSARSRRSATPSGRSPRTPRRRRTRRRRASPRSAAAGRRPTRTHVTSSRPTGPGITRGSCQRGGSASQTARPSAAARACTFS